ncbi:hypothetical protein QFZ24_000312 [Streptomyces phaeochromogenes]|jgi:hypothetical protein|nr:hypothetical protein [Streptomyces phaeochromogenes]MDQ0946389.1 hypothetical protein [Streptomyces phaeochromogenes]
MLAPTLPRRAATPEGEDHGQEDSGEAETQRVIRLELPTFGQIAGRSSTL